MFNKEEFEALPEDKRELFAEQDGVYVPKAVIEASQFKTQAEKYQSELTSYQQKEKEREDALKAQLEADYLKKLDEAQKKHGGDSDEVRKILEEKHKHEIEQARLSGATEKEKEFALKLAESSAQSHRKELASLGKDEASKRLLNIIARDSIKIVDGKETFFDVDGKALSFEKLEDYLAYVKKDEAFQDLISGEVNSLSPDFAKGSKGKSGTQTNETLEALKTKGDGVGYLNAHFAQFFNKG